MKNSVILTVILSLFTISYSYTQPYAFQYRFDWVKSEVKPNLVSHGTSILIVTDSMSRFQDTEYGKPLDNLFNSETKTFSAFLPYQYSYIIYKKQETLRFQQSVGDFFNYEEPIADMEWKIIEDETKEILDYECIKAVGHLNGREYTAWFSSDIPISNGPHKFGGLPGLIFQIEDTESKFKFTLAGIENWKDKEIPEQFNLEDYNRGSIITKKQLYDRQVEAMEYVIKKSPLRSGGKLYDPDNNRWISGDEGAEKIGQLMRDEFYGRNEI